MGVSKRLYGHRMLSTRPTTSGDHLAGLTGRPRCDEPPAPAPAARPQVAAVGPVRDPDGPPVGMSARRFGATRDRLDYCIETGDPIAHDNARYTVDRRVCRDDGSADYWLRDRWGGRLLVACEAPRSEPASAEPPVELGPIRRDESGVTARFLDALFRSGHDQARPVVYGIDQVDVEGDSRPTNGQVFWFLRRCSDGRKLIVRLNVPRPAPTPAPPAATSRPLPPAPTRPDRPRTPPRSNLLRLFRRRRPRALPRPAEKGQIVGASTEIAWPDKTWSPWTGCTKVSPGCATRPRVPLVRDAAFT